MLAVIAALPNENTHNIDIIIKMANRKPSIESDVSEFEVTKYCWSTKNSEDDEMNVKVSRINRKSYGGYHPFFLIICLILMCVVYMRLLISMFALCQQLCV